MYPVGFRIHAMHTHRNSQSAQQATRERYSKGTYPAKKAHRSSLLESYSLRAKAQDTTLPAKGFAFGAANQFVRPMAKEPAHLPALGRCQRDFMRFTTA